MGPETSVLAGVLFGGNHMPPHTGQLFGHQVVGPIEFTFPVPIQQFGGYVATISLASGGTV
jgi:hypothetical protein